MILLDFLLAEVALQQALERLAVTGLVARHFMDCVVQRVEIVLLAQLGQVGLAGSRAVFGLDANGQVLLGGRGNDLAQQLGELGGVLGLLQTGLLPVCLLYTSPSPRDSIGSRMPSSA